MSKRILTEEHLRQFSAYLCTEEKSAATREKYLRDVRRFRADLGGEPVSKERVAAWKNELQEQGYAVRSVNSMLASVNCLLGMLGWGECRVKSIRLQRQTYCPEEQELSREDYMRLLRAALKDEQLYLILQAICSTGIRVSELRWFTVEAMGRGTLTVSCKGKTRTIFLPGQLRKKLLRFARSRGIGSGPIFRNSKGGILDRSTIWRRMSSCAGSPVWPRRRSSPIICGSSSPAHFMKRRRIWPSWRMFWATAASTPPGSTS